MADTLKVSLHGARIAAAVALDCAGYIDANPGTTNGDIAQLLKVDPAKLSEMKNGKVQVKGEQAAIMARFGMRRTLMVLNEIADERDCCGTADIAFARAMDTFKAANEMLTVTLVALQDSLITADERPTIEARILDLMNACQLLLRSIRGMGVSR